MSAEDFSTFIDAPSGTLHVGDVFKVRVSIKNVDAENGYCAVNIPLVYDPAVIKPYNGTGETETFTEPHYPDEWTGTNEKLDSYDESAGTVHICCTNDGEAGKGFRSDTFYTDIRFIVVGTADSTRISAVAGTELFCTDDKTLAEKPGKGSEVAFGPFKRSIDWLMILFGLLIAAVVGFAVWFTVRLKKKPRKKEQ